MGKLQQALLPVVLKRAICKSKGKKVRLRKQKEDLLKKSHEKVGFPLIMYTAACLPVKKLHRE